MRHLILAAVIAAAAAPAPAQDAPPPPAEEQPSRPIVPFLEDWANRTEDLMRELMEEVGPEMERLMAEMLPELERLGELVGGLSNYELPEIMPNGDIIIRRKPDAPPLPEDFLENRQDDGPVDL